MPKGRMLNKVISTSEKLSKVSIHSALLYTWMIPHLDIGGKIFGNPEQIKGIVIPYRKEFTIKKIESCLKELSEVGLILVYGTDCKYILLNNFDTHQTLNESREAPSNIPNPSPDLIQSLSRGTPQEVKLNISKDKVNIRERIIINNFPTKEEVVLYFTESGYPKEMGESFFSYYDAQEWLTTGGASIAKRWQSKVQGWLNNQKQFEKTNKKEKPTSVKWNPA